MKPSLSLFTCLVLSFVTAHLGCQAAEKKTWLMAEENRFYTGVNRLYDDMKKVSADDVEVRWVKPYKVLPYDSIFPDIPYRQRLGIQRSWRLMHEDEQTVLHCYFVMPFDSVKDVWLGGDEAYIVDTKTGIRYKSRGTTDPDMWNQTFGIKGKAGTLIEFLVYFPPLPPEVKEIKIFGVQKWNLRGKRVSIKSEHDTVGYDSPPSFRTPKLLEEKDDYNKDDMDTYDVYGDAHLIKPVKEMTMAMWRTPETTYLAIAMELDWTREYFTFPSQTSLVDQYSGKMYMLRRVQGLPMNKLFFIEGIVGDMVAFVLEFEPLTFNTNTIIYNQPDIEPFEAWGANWHGEVIRDLSVSELISNQPLFDYSNRIIVK